MLLYNQMFVIYYSQLVVCIKFQREFDFLLTCEGFYYIGSLLLIQHLPRYT
eukprot:jgi/Orpsp1_1/1177819/evm.model.c7180000062995.1